MIDNNWWYTECQATYNIQSIDSSNAIIHFTRICACLVGGNNRCPRAIIPIVESCIIIMILLSVEHWKLHNLLIC